MQRVYSMSPLERIAYFAHGSTPADVYLRENIEAVTEQSIFGGEVTYWQADEVQLQTLNSLEEVEENFDELWVTAERASRSLEERVTELEDQLGAAIDVLLMMSEEA